MSEITAKQFALLWKSFIQHITNRPDWKGCWNNDKKWSELLLGVRRSSTEDSPLGNYFKEQIPDLKYRSEDALFDLTMSLKPNFVQVPTLNRAWLIGTLI